MGIILGDNNSDNSDVWRKNNSNYFNTWKKK